MSFEAIISTFGIRKETVTTTEKFFLLSCAHHAGENHEFYLSTKEVSMETGLNRKTIVNARKSAINKKLLEYTGSFKWGPGKVRGMRLTYVNNNETGWLE